MKKNALSILCLSGLVFMSFTNANSSKSVNINESNKSNFKNNPAISADMNLKGVKNTIVVGTSATAYPGDSQTICWLLQIPVSEETNNSKLDEILKKY